MITELDGPWNSTTNQGTLQSITLFTCDSRWNDNLA